MTNYPLSIFNTYSIYIADVSKSKEEDSRWFDPAKATVVVALVTLVGTLGSAFIAKADLLFSNARVESAMAVQAYKYDQINTELDNDLRDVETETMAVTNKSLPEEEKVQKYQALKEVREKVLAVKTALPKQFSSYQGQFRAGDHVAALKTQSDVNSELAEMRSVIQSHRSKLPGLKGAIIVVGMMHKRTMWVPVKDETPEVIEPAGAELCGPSVLHPTWN
jgi:hypothetical protein